MNNFSIAASLIWLAASMYAREIKLLHSQLKGAERGEEAEEKEE